MRYLAYVRYEGTNYQGWQIQPNGPSIEEEIEKVLSRILNTPTKIYGSGRTDAGVHALAQTFHFDTENPILDLDRFRYSLNSLLPKDIYIDSIHVVDDNFHARYDVIGKTYIYVLNMGEYDLFNRRTVTQFLRKLDVDKMKECTSLFLGEHNFKNFTSKEEDKNDFVRTITSFDIRVNEDFVFFQISGSGFMRYMVRIIVGTLVQVGLGKLTKEDILDYLTREDRSVAPYKAPPEGLALVAVDYGEHKDA